MPEDSQLNAALEQLNSLLVEGEILQAWAVQRRPFALTHRRILVAATSARFIALQRKLFGGFDMADFRWQDLVDAQLKVGMLAADIGFRISGASDLATGAAGPRALLFAGLEKEQAQQVYRFAQGQEQAWREKRRIRDLEEMRARSGGVQFGASPQVSGTGGAAPFPANDATARLQQARQMLDAKLISDSEYEAIKARIINGV